MSNERDSAGNPDPYSATTTCVYDGDGRLRSVQDAAARTVCYRYESDRSAPRTPADDSPAPPAGNPPERRSLEFRLCGTEAQQQAFPVEAPAGAALLVAIERVQAFLSGDGPAGATARGIGGIDVHAEIAGGTITCTAQVSDFQPADLVVVRVDLAVYA